VSLHRHSPARPRRNMCAVLQERQLEIVRAARAHPNIFVFGKKQEAWNEVAQSLNPNPIFAGCVEFAVQLGVPWPTASLTRRSTSRRLTATTARDKYEEMKNAWVVKNRSLLHTDNEVILVSPEGRSAPCFRGPLPSTCIVAGFKWDPLSTVAQSSPLVSLLTSFGIVQNGLREYDRLFRELLLHEGALF
jgi:hypothetical protein